MRIIEYPRFGPVSSIILPDETGVYEDYRVYMDGVNPMAGSKTLGIEKDGLTDGAIVLLELSDGGVAQSTVHEGTLWETRLEVRLGTPLFVDSGNGHKVPNPNLGVSVAM